MDLLSAVRDGHFMPSDVKPDFSGKELTFAALGERFEPEDGTADEDLLDDEVRGVLMKRHNGRGYYLETPNGAVRLASTAVGDLDLAGGAEANLGRTIEGRVGESGAVVEIIFRE
jgi:hypothetical protein